MILDLVSKYSGEITLVPTGSLTNLATAIRKDPRAMRKVKDIILMGGAVNVPGNVVPKYPARFNFVRVVDGIYVLRDIRSEELAGH